ncbi:STAS domain-containing protein [Salinibius halmophilus]|uniref:STAS domain-containing protein n=1 Tax=Salinibius halmophilus TaxID=1853216 RepID=UPI000E66B230|nr:STAS domain-containing protein [Salinibius halmophilus]
MKVNMPERFDFSAFQKFEEVEQSVLAQAGTVSLDFSHTIYIDSAALGMLVQLHEKASANGVQVVLTNLAGAVEKTMKIANMERLFTIQ